MAKVKTLILRAPGTNRDGDTKFAFEQAGSAVEIVHINRLFNKEVKLADFQILVVAGGFSYGDDIAAGKVLANELRVKLGGGITRFIENGGLVMGVCNGFQALVKAGFLPEITKDGAARATLTNNDSGKFECRWVYLKENEKSRCVFTQGVGTVYAPIAHGEGKFVTSGKLPVEHIALYYADESGNTSAGYPHNPNGSQGNIAGVCDSTGRVFGLMPHPEDHISGTQHPQWTRLGAKKQGDGLKIFRNAVNWVKQS